LAITNHAALYPYSYLVGLTVLSFLLLGTGFATNFDMSVAADESYTAKNSVLNERKEWVATTSGFPPPPLSLRALIHANGESVLTQEGIERAFQVVETVKNTPSYDILCNSKHHYTQEAAKTSGGYGSQCHVRGITLLWNNSLSTMREDVESDVNIWKAVAAENYPDGGEIDAREILGRPSHHDNRITGAESLLMEVMIPGFHTQSPRALQDTLSRMLDLRQQWSADSSSGYRLEVFTNKGLESETTRAVMMDTPLIAIVFVIMTIYTCIIFSSNNSGRALCRILFGFGAVISVVLSLATSYGLLYIIGTLHKRFSAHGCLLGQITT
jgi:Patched family